MDPPTNAINFMVAKANTYTLHTHGQIAPQ